MAHQTLMRKCVRSALFAVVLPTAAFAVSLGQRFELAYLMQAPNLRLTKT